jgi:hypothetical protein
MTNFSPAVGDLTVCRRIFGVLLIYGVSFDSGSKLTRRAVGFFFDFGFFPLSYMLKLENGPTQNTVVVRGNKITVFFGIDSFEILNLAQVHLCQTFLLSEKDQCKNETQKKV